MQAADDLMFDEADGIQMADNQASENQTAVWLKRVALLLVGLLVLAAIGYGLKQLMAGNDAKPKKKITTIALKDLPPPPPPPPPKEQPKEQPKDQPKELKEAPQPKPVEAPPTEVLKMDGPAGDGPSAIAAGNPVGEYKGEKLSDVKTIGGDGGAKYNWYAGLLKNQIQEALEKDKSLKENQYKFIVSVWVKTNGDIEKLEWSGSDAEPEIQQAVKAALDNMPAMREMPPEGMPRPIKLRISARKIG